jgi:hypothetical protein
MPTEETWVGLRTGASSAWITTLRVDDSRRGVMGHTIHRINGKLYHLGKIPTLAQIRLEDLCSCALS